MPEVQNIPLGNWTITLNGTTVVNGSFNAWVDRNNRGFSGWQAPFLQENQLTLGVPSTARRPITVGNHMKTGPPPTVSGRSGRGPTRDWFAHTLAQLPSYLIYFMTCKYRNVKATHCYCAYCYTKILLEMLTGMVLQRAYVKQRCC